MNTLLPDPKDHQKETPVIAIDCEMVICEDQQRHLARVSIVNYNRHVLFDEYIKPTMKITNYLKEVTNLDSIKIGRAMPLSFYKEKLEGIFKDKKIVGHTLESDFKALNFDIREYRVRDISEFSFFKNGKFKESLKNLTSKFLKLGIQGGSHSSVEDARAALELYKLYQKEIDRETKDQQYHPRVPLVSKQGTAEGK